MTHQRKVDELQAASAPGLVLPALVPALAAAQDGLRQASYRNAVTELGDGHWLGQDRAVGPFEERECAARGEVAEPLQVMAWREGQGRRWHTSTMRCASLSRYGSGARSAQIETTTRSAADNMKGAVRIRLSASDFTARVLLSNFPNQLQRIGK